MATKNKIVTMLGFAQKSGNLLAGNEIVLKSLDRNRLKLVLIGSDVSEKSVVKIKNRCLRLKVPFYSGLSVAQLSQAIGKHNRTVIGVLDDGFAKRIIELIGDIGD